ncbi:hypothetical protein D3C76_977010 [compost metagenome]
MYSFDIIGLPALSYKLTTTFFALLLQDSVTKLQYLDHVSYSLIFSLRLSSPVYTLAINFNSLLSIS